MRANIGRAILGGFVGTLAITLPMMDREWEGGKKDERLYRKVRAEKQKLVREKYDRLKPFLDERSRRLWAANEAIAFGKGGIRAISEVLEMSPRTVIDGTRELKGELEGEEESDTTLLPTGRQRRPGGGRKSLAEPQPGLVKAIEQIVDPATRGDPMTPLISAELKQQGFQASPKAVSRILWEDLKYSLQGLKKTKEGAKQHPDRDAQFQYLSQQSKIFNNGGSR